MSSRRIPFHILLIDDDVKMNERLHRLLSGLRIHVDEMVVQPEINVIDVKISGPDPEGFFRVTDGTIRNLIQASASSKYDLVMVDFGFADDPAKDFFWGKNRKKHPPKEYVKGRLPTIRDLANQLHSALQSGNVRPRPSNSVFLSARRVILRSMATNLAIDTFGPVIPDRLNETKAAFPNAEEVVPIDPRNEFYGGDAFYAVYELKKPKGREFYRQLIGAYIQRVVETEVLRKMVHRSGSPRIRRSVLNIALFAGSIAFIGGATQYISEIGLAFLGRGAQIGWAILAGGFASLGIGALTLSIYFETFSRAVVKWVGPDEDFRDR